LGHWRPSLRLSRYPGATALLANSLGTELARDTTNPV